ncbi:MAG: T9SS type A sorting domain-containing protein [Ignavibacteriaceae bacterium]|nr:T9SS type A sorting domain-containing protein [Ignavibacteriaceae bacterium]
MRHLYTMLFICVFSLITFSQKLQVEKPIYSEVNESYWDIDYLVLDNEPIGMMAGIQTTNGDLYIAINDTLSTANLGLIVRKSTDGGITWSTLTGVNNRTKYEKIKLIKSSFDSVYCFFQIGFDVYSWNIHSSTINPVMVAGAYRTFDVEITSSNSIYIVVDSLLTNHIIRYSSLDFGLNWGFRGNISASAALPVMNKSASGDTLFICYFGPILADTATSILRVVRYRETAPGTVLSATFQDIASGVFPKYEYKTAAGNGVAWFMYTKLDGTSQIWARLSTDAGTTYGAEFRVNPNETVNQYGFDLKSRLPAGNGFSFVYHADSSQSGTATSETDKLQFGTSMQDGSTFQPFTQINFAPVLNSASGCKPIIVENPMTTGTGVAWLAETVAGNKVYWDASYVIPVELTSFSAEVFSGKVILSWSTATELNNAGFEIERKSSNSQAFEKIGYVTGNGTTTETVKYRFDDSNVPAGIFTYRLKQVDFDGSFEYSNEIEVESIVPQVFYMSQNYPNPFNPTTNIVFGLPVNSRVTVSIYDALGQLVNTLVNGTLESGVHTLSFDAGKLNSGIYFYTIKADGVNGSNFSETKKMILTK